MENLSKDILVVGRLNKNNCREIILNKNSCFYTLKAAVDHQRSMRMFLVRVTSRKTGTTSFFFGIFFTFFFVFKTTI